jgi:MFS-type transporter involved in bile tolerance (Atg22 family)
VCGVWLGGHRRRPRRGGYLPPSSRVLLTALTPVEKSGEFWGALNLLGRTASVAGDATWSGIPTIFGERILGYQVAVAELALYILLGAWLVWLVPAVRPSAANSP